MGEVRGGCERGSMVWNGMEWYGIRDGKREKQSVLFGFGFIYFECFLLLLY